jgi:hypothetical protein
MGTDPQNPRHELIGAEGARHAAELHGATDAFFDQPEAVAREYSMHHRQERHAS